MENLNLMSQNIHRNVTNTLLKQTTYINLLSFRADNGQNLIISLLMKLDRLGVVKDAQQMRLDGMRITSLAKDLKKGGVGDEEETWKEETLFLQVPVTKGENEHLIITSTIIPEKILTYF